MSNAPQNENSLIEMVAHVDMSRRGGVHKVLRSLDRSMIFLKL